MRLRTLFMSLVMVFGLLPLVAGSAANAQADLRQVPRDASEITLSFSPIVKQTAPAVVNVYAKRVTQQRRPIFNDPFFDQFFNRNGRGERLQPRVSRSLGSGVVVTAEGRILTNNHVIEDATEIKISDASGREYDVELVFADPRTDLAVLQIIDGQGRDFPFLEFADSDLLEVGDLVLAIGNPFGVGQTVTSGIVSALARTQVSISDFNFFIQTDASINPGNSGGALVDMAGRLVGINSAIYSRSGGSNGIGFAIPANMARVIAAVGDSDGKLLRPWFGGTLQSISVDIAESLDLAQPRGALITDIVRDGPADGAGLRVGDVVLKLNDFAIGNPDVLFFRMATSKIGDEVILQIYRDGALAQVSMVLRVAPETVPRNITKVSGGTPFSGLRIANLSPALAEEINIDAGLTGVIVLGVARGSRADRVGFKPHDIVMEINGNEVALVKDFKRRVRRQTTGWRIIFKRDGRVFRSFIGD